MTEEKIQEAAQRLFDKKEISQEEHDAIKTAASMSAGGWGSFAKAFKGALLPVAGAAATAVVGKELIVDPIIESRKIKKSFAAMTKKVPQLAEKDQEQLKDYFNVVKTFSPRTASNPLVAGHLVNKMIEFGGVDHKLVQDIAAIQAGLTTPKVTQTALEAGAKAVAGSPGKD